MLSTCSKPETLVQDQPMGTFETARVKRHSILKFELKPRRVVTAAAAVGALSHFD